VRNAQLLHERANELAEDGQRRINEVMERSYAPVRTVTTVYLTVPVPSATLIPTYTVIGPTSVRDGFGRVWWYRNYSWYLY
jgi:hypothetical protein